MCVCVCVCMCACVCVCVCVRLVPLTCSMHAGTPARMSRSNSDSDSPARPAASLWHTGGSWQWSPTSTACREAYEHERGLIK